MRPLTPLDQLPGGCSINAFVAGAAMAQSGFACRLLRVYKRWGNEKRPVGHAVLVFDAVGETWIYDCNDGTQKIGPTSKFGLTDAYAIAIAHYTNVDKKQTRWLTKRF